MSKMTEAVLDSLRRNRSQVVYAIKYGGREQKAQLQKALAWLDSMIQAKTSEGSR